MNQINGVVDYLKFFPQGRILFECLTSAVQDNNLRLIFVITRAAGRWGGANIDVYSTRKCIVPPDSYKEEGVYSFWKNPFTKEELLLMIQEPHKREKIIVIDCGNIRSREDLILMLEERALDS